MVQTFPSFRALLLLLALATVIVLSSQLLVLPQLSIMIHLVVITAIAALSLSALFRLSRIFLFSMTVSLVLIGSSLFEAMVADRASALSLFKIYFSLIAVVLMWQRDGLLWSRTTSFYLFLYVLMMVVALGPINFLMGSTLVEKMHAAAFELAWLSILDLCLVLILLVAALVSLSRARYEDIGLSALAIGAIAIVSAPDKSTGLWLAIYFYGLAVVLVIDNVVQRIWLDNLTQLAGRQKFDSDLQGMPIGSWAAFIDVDYFKKFNDRYGHLNGDRALVKVAGILSKIRGAQAYRFGGEEFVLLIKPLSEEQVEKCLDTIRVEISESVVTLKNHKKGSARLSVSLGGAKRKRSEPLSLWLKRADEQLYKAKTSGRNRVALDRT